jgi:hypothetical protein
MPPAARRSRIGIRIPGNREPSRPPPELPVEIPAMADGVGLADAVGVGLAELVSVGVGVGVGCGVGVGVGTGVGGAVTMKLAQRCRAQMVWVPWVVSGMITSAVKVP